MERFLEETTQWLDNNQELLSGQLCGLIAQGLEAYPDTRHVNISLLRSSALDHHPLYRLDFYNEKHYIDLQAYSLYWDLPAVTKLMHSRLPQVDEFALREAQRKQQIRNEVLLIELAEMFHSMLIGRVGQLLGEALPEQRNSEKQVICYWGEYLHACREFSMT